MSVKEVKRFLNEAKDNIEFSEFIRKNLNGEFFSEEQISELFEREIIPFARKHSFDVNKADFAKFAEQRESGAIELDLDDLEDVAGGRCLFVKSAFSMFLCLTEFVGFASSNFVHAVGDPLTSIQESSAEKTENEGSEQESQPQNTEDKVFEISDVEADGFNPEDVHKLKLSNNISLDITKKIFPNLKAVEIPADFSLEKSFELSLFLANNLSIEDIEVEDGNEDYIFIKGILYSKKNDMGKLWISDKATEFFIEDLEDNLLESNRVYNNLKKITLKKDAYVSIDSLRIFEKNNQGVTIDVEEGNKYYSKQGDLVKYLPLNLPVDWKSEEIKDLDLVDSFEESVTDFKNLNTITIHSSYTDAPSSLISLLKNNSNVGVVCSEENKIYKKKEGVLFYNGYPFWRELDKITEINMEREMDNICRESIKGLKNLRTINIKENYKGSPDELMDIILNNPKAEVFLRDKFGNEVKDIENYTYGNNGILYHKATGLPITKKLDEIRELTLKSKFNSDYFKAIGERRLDFKNLEKITFSKDFEDNDNMLKVCLCLMSSVGDIVVDEDNSHYISNKEGNILKEKGTGNVIWDINYKAQYNQKFIDLLPTTFEECKPYLDIRKPDKYKSQEEDYRNISKEMKLEIAKQVVKILSDSLDDVNVDEYMDEQVYDRLDELNSKIQSRTTRAQKIYEWMAENLAYNRGDLVEQSCDSSYRNHPAQVFKNKYGICRGFARLANVMLRLAGVPSIRVFSHLDEDDTGHAFNLIFTGEGETGEWALMDVTGGSYKKVNIDEVKLGLDNEVNGNIKESEADTNSGGEIDKNYFPYDGDIKKFNRYMVNKGEGAYLIDGFRLRKRISDKEFEKFKVSDSKKEVRIKNCLVDEDGKLVLSENIKNLDDFWLIYEGDYTQKVSKLDLSDCKIKVSRSIFKLTDLKKENIILGENPNYVWENDILYYKDENTKLPICGNIEKAENLTLSKVNDSIIEENLKFENLRTLTIESDFDVLEYKIRAFLELNSQIKTIEVKKGNTSYLMENEVLYYLEEGEKIPLWGNFENINEICCGERWFFFFYYHKTFKNLKKLKIKKDFDVTANLIIDFLEKNPQIETIEVEEENSLYSMKEGVLFYMLNEQKLPLWKDVKG